MPRSAKQHPRYDDNVHQKALTLLQGGKSFGEVSKELGPSVQTLHKWKQGSSGSRRVSRPAQASGKTARRASEVEDENRKLRSDRELLKRALALFVEP